MPVLGVESTACLIQYARVMAEHLPGALLHGLGDYVALLRRLSQVRATLLRRTQAPYSLGVHDYEPLPAIVLRYWPFDEHARWESDLAAFTKGRLTATVTNRAAREEVGALDGRETGQTLETLARRLEAAPPAKDVAVTVAPVLSHALGLLRARNLADIEAQTGVPLRSSYAETPLANRLDCLLFHGVFTVVLDRRGRPTTLDGALRYPILVGEAGSAVERHLQRPGLYVSVQQAGFGDFRLDDSGITKVLFGGVGALRDGPNRAHVLQDRIQSHLNRGHVFVAALVMPSAFERGELTAANVERKLPTLIDATLPHLADAVKVRALALYGNREGFAKAVATEAVKEFLYDRAKHALREYLVRKVGSKLVPGAGLVNMAEELFDDEERTRVRHMLGCLMMHVRGKGPDDLHVASLTLAQLIGELLQDALLEALVRRVVGAANRVSSRATPTGTGQDRVPADQDASDPASTRSTGEGGAGNAPPAANPAGDVTSQRATASRRLDEPEAAILGAMLHGHRQAVLPMPTAASNAAATSPTPLSSPIPPEVHGRPAAAGNDPPRVSSLRSPDVKPHELEESRGVERVSKASRTPRDHKAPSSRRAVPGRSSRDTRPDSDPHARQRPTRTSSGDGPETAHKVSAHRSTDERLAAGTTVLPGVVISPAGLRTVIDDASPALRLARRHGLTFKLRDMHQGHPDAARFQVQVTGVALEMSVGAPGVAPVDIDGVAVDVDVPGGLIFVEAKATFVNRIEDSYHLRYNEGKVKQIANQLALILATGAPVRIEIVCSVHDGPTGPYQGLPETYLMTLQHLTLPGQPFLTGEARKKFRALVLEYLRRERGAPVARLSARDLERVVDRYVSVSVMEFDPRRGSAKTPRR